MSTADLELFGPPDADGTYPRFTTVLRGYDPDQVRDYILRLAARVETLERELEETRSQRDAARKRYGSAKDDAYNQLGERMADMLRLADQQAEKIRWEAEEESKQRLSQARHVAMQVEREAELRAEQVRSEGEEALHRAIKERDGLMGGLTASRDLALADLAATKDHLAGIVERLEIAMEVARSARVGDEQPAEEQRTGEGEEPTPASRPDPERQVEDILVRTEGFDIMLPEFLLREPEDGEPQL